MLRKSSVLFVVVFVQLTAGQSLHAGRYYASAPVFSAASALPPGPGPAAPGSMLPVAAPPAVPPFPGPLMAPFPASPAAAPGVVPAMSPPSPAFAPGFPGAFGPFGSNKKNERHPIGEEEKPAADAQPMAEPPVTVDPNAPKVEAKRTVPAELSADNSTQPAFQAAAQETVTEKPAV